MPFARATNIYQYPQTSMNVSIYIPGGGFLKHISDTKICKAEIRMGMLDYFPKYFMFVCPLTPIQLRLVSQLLEFKRAYV